MSDTRTPAEIRYDATKLSRTWEPVQQITDNPADDGVWREIIAIVTDTPLSDTEAQCLDILLARPTTRSRDARHREERMIAILEQIAELPEPAQSETLRMLERALDAA